MPNILVTPEQLQSVSSQLNAGAANIESTLSQLAAQVAPLQAKWRGRRPSAPRPRQLLHFTEQPRAWVSSGSGVSPASTASSASRSHVAPWLSSR